MHDIPEILTLLFRIGCVDGSRRHASAGPGGLCLVIINRGQKFAGDSSVGSADPARFPAQGAEALFGITSASEKLSVA